MSILQALYKISTDLAETRAKLLETNSSTARVVLSQMAKRWKEDQQQPALYGIHRALCVDTLDPLGQGRVRFYSPLLDNKNATTKQLPFARPVSALGGFDDCGATWVPPAGSTLMIMFEGGQRSAPYYVGTTWNRNRGQPPHDYGVAIIEYDKFHSRKRDGYLLGDQNSQIYMPWNTEIYNKQDIDSLREFNQDTEAQRKMKIPHGYGFKTPQKHRLKMMDGMYECNFKWKRLELASGNGNWLMMKDDHIHNAAQWAHEKCNCKTPGSDLTDCTDTNGNPKEKPFCDDRSISGGEPDNPIREEQESCANPNFKREEECRPYKGPGTPENNRCQLPQTGIQICSISGQTIIFDDSVEQPYGTGRWQNFLDDFNFGCNDRFMGRILIKSTTGHTIELNDIEDEAGSQERGKKNGINLITATGNYIKLCDHTVNGLAGSSRGIDMGTTSTHVFRMMDEENEQKSENRKSGGVPINKSKKAFIQLKSGYGLELLMSDDFSQEKTQQQFIRLMAPQKDNITRGQHLLWMQEQPEGPGSFLIRAGGYFVGISYDEWTEIIGTSKNPASKIVNISDSKYETIQNTYFNKCGQMIVQADDYIMMMAGKDCPDPETGDLVPCVGRMVLLNPSTGRLGLSSRVFGSIKPDDEGVTLAMLSSGGT